MKLIDEIIDVLSSEDVNLTAALLKTKVLVHKLGEKSLLQWINGELQGYEFRDNVPSYRVVKMIIRATISNGYYRMSDQVMPIMHLEEDIRNLIEITKIDQSISVIEVYAKNNNVRRTVPPELYGDIEQALGNNYSIESACACFPAGSMTQILTEVKSRLLEFLLELSENFPEELDSKQMKSKSKEVKVSEIFKNAVFGDNATIIVGDANTQNAKNMVTRNDFSSLRSAFKENGIQDED